MQQLQIKRQSRKRSTAQDDVYAESHEAKGTEGVDRRRKLSVATDEVLANVRQILEGEAR
jgi:hypothetical protein